MEATWPAWRLYAEGHSTLSEIHSMSIDVVDLANMALDAMFDAQHGEGRPEGVDGMTADVE